MHCHKGDPLDNPLIQTHLIPPSAIKCERSNALTLKLDKDAKINVSHALAMTSRATE